MENQKGAISSSIECPVDDQITLPNLRSRVFGPGGHCSVGHNHPYCRECDAIWWEFEDATWGAAKNFGECMKSQGSSETWAHLKLERDAD